MSEYYYKNNHFRIDFKKANEEQTLNISIKVNYQKVCQLTAYYDNKEGFYNLSDICQPGATFNLYHLWEDKEGNLSLSDITSMIIICRWVEDNYLGR